MLRASDRLWRFFYFFIYIPGYLAKGFVFKFFWNLGVYREKKGELRFDGGKGSAKGSAKVCIFAAYPEENYAYIQSIKNAISGIVENNYKVIFICNREPNNELIVYLKSHKVTVIVRPNKGRDFAAYQTGIFRLLDSDRCSELKNLILINDTLYWPEKSTYIIKDLETKPWSCLYLNLEGHTHAQSFLLHFNSNVFLSESFQRFWHRYVPMNSKRHLIHRGEIALTSALLESGFRIEPLVNPNLIKDVFSLVSNSEKVYGLSLGGIKPVGSLPRRVDRARADSFMEYLLNPFDKKQNAILNLSKKQTHQEFINFLITNVYSDPPHRIGLHLTKISNYPFKRDIYKFQSFGNIMYAIEDFEAEFMQSVASNIGSQMQNYMKGDWHSRYRRKLGEK